MGTVISEKSATVRFW